MLPGIFVCFFCLSVPAQKTENELTFIDKRQIIETLLNEKFRKSPEKTIYISTANLSDEIQKDFPLVKNKKIRFISPENLNAQKNCAYQFGEFKIEGKFVSIEFGTCEVDLAYDFRKFGNTWKSVGLSITK